jgi:hypothetical protein
LVHGLRGNVVTALCFIEEGLDFRNHYRRRVDHLGAVPRRFNPRVHRLEFIEGKGFPEHVRLRLQIRTHVDVLAISLRCVRSLA